MNFDKFKKTCVEHYEEIVNAFCESASSYNIVFPKNEVEYTYYFENNDNNKYSFIIAGETYYNDLSGNIIMTIFFDTEKKSVKAKFDYNYDYFGDDCNGYGPNFTKIIEFAHGYETFENDEFWNELIDEISNVTY